MTPPTAPFDSGLKRFSRNRPRHTVHHHHEPGSGRSRLFHLCKSHSKHHHLKFHGFCQDLIRRTRARKKRLEKEMGQTSADQPDSDFVFDVSSRRFSFAFIITRATGKFGPNCPQKFVRCLRQRHPIRSEAEVTSETAVAGQIGSVLKQTVTPVSQSIHSIHRQVLV